jgi:methenyltetrahydromethanopterin cyclohydrolase
MMEHFELNARGCALAKSLEDALDDLRLEVFDVRGAGRIYDFGVNAEGGLNAGIVLAEACLADLGEVTLQQGTLDGISWPYVVVTTDQPVAACLLSQYAGWQISVGDYFGMGSGPMRAAAAREPLFERLGYREQTDEVAGVLETGRLPDLAVFEFIAEKTGVEPSAVDQLVAPTSSQAGNLQVVARSIETALHKLFELGFDVTRIASGFGSAPLPPVADGDLNGIGRTNDAILYGASVSLWVHGDDESIAEIGPKVPAMSSDCYGRPFLEIFEAAGKDFYKIDPRLFSPAEILFQNLDTGRVQRFGKLDPGVLRTSFGF